VPPLQRSRRATPLALLTCLALAATSVTALPLLLTQGAQAVEAPADASSAATSDQAAAIAAEHDHPVIIESELTETTSLSARPDGTTRLEMSSEPVRVRQGGEWVDIDLTLERSKGGWIQPRATAVPVQFAGGGESAIARIQTETDRWISESWDLDALPRPSLRGATATYADVLEDVDLKLTATTTGMTEVLVIKTPDAASDPQLADLQLKIAGAALLTGEQGSIVATAKDGTDVTSSLPTWWDSSHPDANAAGPGGDNSSTVVPHETSSTAVTLDVAAVTTDESLVYPVYIDPDWSAGASPFWMTDRFAPNQSYLNGQFANGNQSVGLGSDSRGTYLSRAFWRFNVASLAGKQIKSAQLGMTQSDSFNACSKVAVQAWRYSSGLGDGFTWNQDQATSDGWDQHLSTTAPCLSAGQSFGMDVSAGVAETSRVGVGSIILGLRSANEADGSGRRHFGQGASLRVDYNTVPNAPSGFSWAAPSRACGPTAGEPSFMNGTQNLVMRINTSDPDAGTNLQTRFRVVPANNGGIERWVSSSPFQAQGTTQLSIPANALAEGAYAVQATTSDGSATSGASPYCFFTIKNSAPALPTLSSTAPGTVGKPLTVSVTARPGDQVRGFAYWWSPSNKATPAPPMPTASVISPSTNYDRCSFVQGIVTHVCAAASGTTSLTVAPVDETSTLYVASYDKAGNVSVDPVTKSNSAGLEIQSSADPAAALPSGHGWTMPSAGDGPLPEVLTDRGTPALPLTLGAGMNKTVTDDILPGPEQAVLAYDNLVHLNRFNGGTHIARVGSVAGMRFEATMGQIFLPGKTSPPTGTSPIYSCALPLGDMTSGSATCEGTGVTGVLLGHIWRTAANVPADVPVRAVYRCYVQATGDHFLSHGSTCEGQRVDLLLGYLADVRPTKTASSAVDTTKSFSVSAWVNLKENNPAHISSYTAVSQEGANSSGFYLQAAGGNWRFCVRSQDATATTDCAVGPAVTTSTWVHLTGVWDANNKQVRVLTGTSTTPTGSSPVVPHTVPAGDTTANGPLVIGSAKSVGMETDLWYGQIYNPIITPGVVSSSQLAARYADQL